MKNGTLALDADGRRVEKILVERLDPDEAPEDKA